MEWNACSARPPSYCEPDIVLVRARANTLVNPSVRGWARAREKHP